MDCLHLTQERGAKLAARTNVDEFLDAFGNTMKHARGDERQSTGKRTHVVLSGGFQYLPIATGVFLKWLKTSRRNGGMSFPKPNSGNAPYVVVAEQTYYRALGSTQHVSKYTEKSEEHQDIK